MTRQSWIGDFSEDAEAGPDLDELPRVQRTAYVAVELNGKSVHEHAEATDREVSAVRSALRQARETLSGGR